MWKILSLWVKNSPTRIFREVYRRIIIAIIREEGHFLRSYIYGWFTEVIFTNIKDQDELFKLLKVPELILIFDICENIFSKPIVNMTTRKMPLFADYRYAIPTVNFTEDAGR